jgi:hypothetical protein
MPAISTSRAFPSAARRAATVLVVPKSMPIASVMALALQRARGKDHAAAALANIRLSKRARSRPWKLQEGKAAPRLALGV